jgi:hypothetical protein
MTLFLNFLKLSSFFSFRKKQGGDHKIPPHPSHPLAKNLARSPEKGMKDKFLLAKPSEGWGGKLNHH